MQNPLPMSKSTVTLLDCKGVTVAIMGQQSLWDTSHCRARMSMVSLRPWSSADLSVCASSWPARSRWDNPNPVPVVNQPLVPMTLPPGGSNFTHGEWHRTRPRSVVNWNDSPLVTTFVSGSQLTATVPASEIAFAEMALVTV